MFAYDIIGEDKAQPGFLVRRLSREERGKYLLDDIGGYPVSIIADADLDTVCHAPGGEPQSGLVVHGLFLFGGGRIGRLAVARLDGASLLVSGMAGVARHVQKHPAQILLN